MSDKIRILDPSGHVEVRELSLAPRPASFNGLRPGVLDNRKANARLIMETMVDGLRPRLRLRPTTTGSKPVAGPPSPDLVKLMRENCDFVVVGSSD